jgi:hypothetical protein
MREQGNPFKGRGPVGIAAADQFVFTVAVFDQFGPAKLLDYTAVGALRENMI